MTDSVDTGDGLLYHCQIIHCKQASPQPLHSHGVRFYFSLCQRCEMPQNSQRRVSGFAIFKPVTTDCVYNLFGKVNIFSKNQDFCNLYYTFNFYLRFIFEL